MEVNIIDLLLRDRDFPRPVLGPYIGPFPIKKKLKNLPKMVYNILNILVLHFVENFIKILTKIGKLQMHENLHKNMNENMFKQPICYSFALLISYTIGVPTSSGNHGKPGKSLKKVPCMEKS